MIRYAIVRNFRTREQAEAYLPGNYGVIWEGKVAAYEGSDREVDGLLIAGVDRQGWTLDGYVIPRFLSGLVGCEEIDLSHPLMKRVPVAS